VHDLISGVLAALLMAVSLQPVLPEVRDSAAVKSVIARSPRPLRVLNLWATWCAPCLAEMPDLNDISRDFHRVEVIGISLDDALPGDRAETKRKVARVLDDWQIRFRNYYFTGRIDELATGLGFDGGLPATFIFDAKGHEVARVSGPIRKKEFAARLNALLKER
jgi:thiol-disulfide isomerase/thioredoxin